MSESENLRTKKIRDAYALAHLETKDGYASANHNFMREDVILHMYEILLIFRLAFTRVGWTAEDLAKKSSLEIGCAWGFRLNQLLGFNLKPANLHGIDLIPQYIDEAKCNSNPAIHYDVMSATRMSFGDKSFDFSFAVMALSAMLDSEVIVDSLSEMCRISRHCVLIIDCFDPTIEDRRNGMLYYKGVDRKLVNGLRDRPDVASVERLGGFWSYSKAAWYTYAVLRKIGLGSLAYAAAIRANPWHSHVGILVRLR